MSQAHSGCASQGLPPITQGWRASCNAEIPLPPVTAAGHHPRAELRLPLGSSTSAAQSSRVHPVPDRGWCEMMWHPAPPRKTQAELSYSALCASLAPAQQSELWERPLPRTESSVHTNSFLFKYSATNFSCTLTVQRMDSAFTLQEMKFLGIAAPAP